MAHFCQDEVGLLAAWITAIEREAGRERVGPLTTANDAFETFASNQKHGIPAPR